MPRVKINDLERNVKLTDEDVKRIRGGLLFPAVQSTDLVQKLAPPRLSLVLPVVNKLRPR